MYRTRWNKRRPLGVSNPVYARESTYDNVSRLVNKYLGSMCPLKNMKELREMEPMHVFRKLEIVPNFNVSRVSVYKFMVQIFSKIDHPPNMDHLLHAYIEIGRFESVDVVEFHPENSMTVFEFFKTIAVPILSYCFYVTETADNQVVYFRRPIWDLLVQKASLAFVSLLDLHSVSFENFKTACTVRWIPKRAGGLRPVISAPKFQRDRSKKLLRFLSCLSTSEKLGFSLLTRNDCRDPLRKYAGRPTFFFTADMQNCFESVTFDLLEKALKNLAPKETLFSSAMVTTWRAAVPILRKRPIVFQKGNLKNLLTQLPSDSIFVSVGAISPEHMNYASVMNSVLTLVKNTVYKLSGDACFGVSERGLPQGSALSCLLVSLCYGYLDAQCGSDTKKCVIVRLIDDVLCFASETETRDKLIENLNLYGVVNREKLVVGDCLSSTIEWAGFRFRPDREGFFNISPNSNFSLTNSNLSSFFSSSMSQHMLAMFFDNRLNSKACMNENAFLAGSVAAKRLKQTLMGKKGSFSEKSVFLSRLVRFVKRRFAKTERPKELARLFYIGFEKSLQ